MKISIKHIAAVILLQMGVAHAQSNESQLKSYSVGIRGAHLYDLASARYDSELNKDLKGLSSANTSFDLGFDVYLEKQFTPLWGIQLGFRNGGLTGSNGVEYYDNSFAEGYADALFNLSNLDKKRREARLNYYAKAGAGYGAFSADRFLEADNSPNGTITDNFWEVRLGAGLQYELNSYLRLELDLAYNVAYNDGFDGYDYSTGSDAYISTGLGLAYTFGQKEDKPVYAVNFFGEEYFGETMVTQNEESNSDSVLSFELAQAQNRMATMEEVIGEQQAAIARLEAEKVEKQNEVTPKYEVVYFDFDSSSLTADAKRELMSKFRGDEKGITLTGYVDNSGTPSYNEKLKADRVVSVKQFLVDVMGFEESIINVELAQQIKDLKSNDFLNRKVVVSYY